MFKSLEGKACVVTGAARSIGLAVAKRYCSDGAKVAMIDINPDVIKEADQLAAQGYSAKGYILDITNRDAVLSCFEQIEKDFGPIYVLVNNAGIVDQRPFEEITADQLNKQLAVNGKGALF